MLEQLSIKNFAIIDELTMQFFDGLTVLTGETGAGKSIIIDAIGLLIGGRGSSEYVRYGAKKAEIEGLFTVQEGHPAIEKVNEFGITAEDGMLILSRDITSQGKSVCRINGKLVTLTMLREVGQLLVDIFGQHEHQILLDPDNHLPLLDSFAKNEINTIKEHYLQLYKRYQQLTKELEKMTKNEQEMAQRKDLIEYQLKEIENAKLLPNEDEQLEKERFKLANSERLYKSLLDSYQCLYGDGKGLDFVMQALSHLQVGKEIDPDLNELYETMKSHYYILEEIAFTLRNKIDEVEFDSDRLQMIELRLDEISKLKRKYGQTVEEILEYAKKIADEWLKIENKDEEISRIVKERKETRKQLFAWAKELHLLRKKTAEKLTYSIHQQLKELYMDKTRFQVKMKSFDYAEDDEKITFTANGIDEVEFYLSTNPGEPLKPLAKIASGGEISRIMLALKSIFTNHHGITSLIFDEVDTGVSGRVAQAIGEKIYRLSNYSQVLCITHLPQVAAMADHHFYIMKEQTAKRTKTKVYELTDEERVNEIGRMISGVEMTKLTKEHAHELLEIAKKLKAK